tara:strand:- start:2115 stop:2366 length:252 start_codon:yes stop_codon:yes gene_type:complete
MDEKELRKEIMKQLTQTNDSCLLVLGNFISSEAMDIEFAVTASDEELYVMFCELFRNETIRDEARKAVLFSDYGKTNDSLNIN